MKVLKRNIILILLVALMTSLFLGVDSFAANSSANTSSSNSSSSKESSNSTSKSEQSNEDISEQTIPEGITIDGVDVSGQTVSKAKKTVDSSLGNSKSTVFKLVAGEKSLDATGKDLDLCVKNADVAERAANYGNEGNALYRYKATKDLEAGRGKDFKISLTAKNASVAEYLEKNKAYIDTKVVNNGLKRENGTFTYVPGTQGKIVDINASAAKISDFISNGWNGQNSTIELIVETKDPIGSQEELASVKDCLGSYVTDYSSSAAGRAKNVRNGCSKINGTILYPGETFSVTEAVVPFTAENGYELAGSYENGTTVETYGGGICQVSTTLYNAIIRAELEVVARNSHSMIVTYVKPSMDAAIAEGILDLKFRNNQETPIYIEGYCENGKINFNIYGKETRDSNREVDFESEVTSTTEAGVSYKYSADAAAGTISREQGPHTGYTARLWKIVKVNGVEQSRNIFNNSTYKASNAVYVIGANGLSAAGKAAIDAAIATNDEGAVRAAVAGAPAAAAAPAEAQPAAEAAPAEAQPAETPAQ
ncbi:MAG: VanW family protein [Lachnospiraceae bacterium]|nr:VanW family protein [Lachnospiraceae bacterium]